MRTDHILYMVAIIFFVITTLTFVLQMAEFERSLWVVTTVVFGLLFASLGYMQRPKMAPASTEVIPVAQPTETRIVTEEQKTEIAIQTTPVAEPAPAAQPEPVAEPTPTAIEITMVKGIKAKRAEQLKGMGINSVNDLADASAQTIADHLQISPKITAKWIENAKELAQKS